MTSFNEEVSIAIRQYGMRDTCMVRFAGRPELRLNEPLRPCTRVWCLCLCGAAAYTYESRLSGIVS